MDRFDALRIFVRIVERRSFSLAATDLGMPRSSVTRGIQQLEARLGVRLLRRTTRHVTPTPDGQAYYQRCLAVMADLDEADAACAGATPQGLVRIDVHGTLARFFLLPSLRRLFDRYPGIRLHVGEADRSVDPIREGVDCMLRVGEPSDSSMIGRRVGVLEQGTYASPEYLARLGTPDTPGDLAGHQMVGFTASSAGLAQPLEFRTGSECMPVMLPHLVSVANPETNVAAALLGLGLVQVPRYRVAANLAAGTLVEVLAGFAPPPLSVYVLYPERRPLSPRARTIIDWLAAEFTTQLDQPGRT